MTEILQPAITLAKEGYPVHQFSSLLQKQNERMLQKTKHSFGDDMLNINGQSPYHGEVMKNPKLAGVFEVCFIFIFMLQNRTKQCRTKVLTKRKFKNKAFYSFTNFKFITI